MQLRRSTNNATRAGGQLYLSCLLCRSSHVIVQLQCIFPSCERTKHFVAAESSSSSQEHKLLLHHKAAKPLVPAVNVRGQAGASLAGSSSSVMCKHEHKQICAPTSSTALRIAKQHVPVHVYPTVVFQCIECPVLGQSQWGVVCIPVPVSLRHGHRQ
jgi:hypothetical protein